jgi:hypothetical protein
MRSNHQKLFWYPLALILISICFVQLRWPAYFAVPLFTGYGAELSMTVLLFSLSPMACWAAMARSADDARTRALVIAVSLFATGFCEVMHHHIVDLGRYDNAFSDNMAWQLHLHQAVLRLDRLGATPHSYRFLPDCIVAFFQWLCGSFNVARVAYRFLANSLLFVVIYRYGRLYLTPVFAAAAILVVAFLYPVTILRYAGQFTDPASHLSFAACLYCLAAGIESGFQSSLFIGVLAKESVAVMAICRAFYGKNRLKSALAAALYLVAAIAIVLAIRFYVNRGPIALAYTSISGTGANQLLNNLIAWREWWAMYAVTLGALVPGAIAGWKHMDKAFRATCIVIAVATLGANLAVSLFWEERNIVPLFIPLAVINLKYLAERLAKVPMVAST